ncbi:MAG: chemotaxis response regulator protein-glutamate methylesterase [Candidatus Cloacimonetes bacterium]|nr:chemotaxis response regulator protein-glutamate methylesterase [Candidatus Cloacimonadota bacterium]
MQDVKVFIVDDMLFVQKLFTKELSKIDGIQVIGSACDPYEARRSIVRDKPDVLILDVEMPKMDGLSFLQKLMEHFPIPTIMFSANSKKYTQYAIKAIRYGAFDFICKPENDNDLHLIIQDLKQKIFEAAKVDIEKLVPSTLVVDLHKTVGLNHNRFVAIGASTGGTRAIEAILTRLPENFPGIVITQHMPAEFTSSFADSLNHCCKLYVKEAEDLEEITPGKVLIAPGNLHLKVVKKDGKFLCNLRTGPLIHYQRPAVDVLFSSIARISDDCIGVILTGMGKDGAQGLLSMKESGCLTIAQDEESSVVFGMPRAAIELKAVDKILSLKDISFHLMKELEL